MQNRFGILRNMECQKKEKQDRVSDFSIDHILNRAGEKCTCVRKCEATVVDSERQLEPEVAMPMFDWLQYTRYRPPKIPSKFLKLKLIPYKHYCFSASKCPL